MDFNFEIKGADEIVAILEKQFSERRVSSIVNKAINIAADEYTEGLAKAISSYKDTGATVEETTHGRATKNSSGRHIAKVGWRGPMQRYKLIHLNEFGYVRHGRSYSPRGMGVIQGYIDGSRNQFLSNMRENLSELVK